MYVCIYIYPEHPSYRAGPQLKKNKLAPSFQHAELRIKSKKNERDGRRWTKKKHCRNLTPNVIPPQLLQAFSLFLFLYHRLPSMQVLLDMIQHSIIYLNPPIQKCIWNIKKSWPIFDDLESAFSIRSQGIHPNEKLALIFYLPLPFFFMVKDNHHEWKTIGFW